MTVRTGQNPCSSVKRPARRKELRRYDAQVEARTTEGQVAWHSHVIEYLIASRAAGYREAIARKSSKHCISAVDLA